jgi:regulator of sirC expression with transglutaminase-like and TPR domain
MRMHETRELSALFNLIDDPDDEVFSTVSERIVGYGTRIIPNLENLWEHCVSTEVQERIEMLIHRLHFTDLHNDFTEWGNGAYHDLLFGALLVAKFQYPDLHTAPVLQEIEKIRRNVWLELNSYLTPLEQANVISSIVYNYYNLKGVEVGYANPNDFFIHKVVQSKKGNSISNGVLYLILAELLDMPVKVINIPRQFILAFFHKEYDKDAHYPHEKIHFYIDAATGNPFTHKDVENYFKRISVPYTPSYFKPMSNKRIIQVMLEELSNCFDSFPLQYKQKELLQLAALLD